MPRLLIPASTTTTAFTLVAALLARPHEAAAFFEDVCYAPGGGPITSCAPLPDVCRPAGTATGACKAAIIAAGRHRRRA